MFEYFVYNKLFTVNKNEYITLTIFEFEKLLFCLVKQNSIIRLPKDAKLNKDAKNKLDQVCTPILLLFFFIFF